MRMNVELREAIAAKMNERFRNMPAGRKLAHLAMLERVPGGAELVPNTEAMATHLDRGDTPEKWAYAAVKKFGLAPEEDT